MTNVSPSYFCLVKTVSSIVPLFIWSYFSSQKWQKTLQLCQSINRKYITGENKVDKSIEREKQIVWGNDIESTKDE